METVVLFDPSIRSLNMGDHVIMNSAETGIRNIVKDKFIIHCATHAPAVTCYQNTSHNPRMRVYDNAKYKFICGSNLLWRNLCLPRPTFNVNLWNCRPYRGSVLLGVGTKQGQKKVNWYTKKLYRMILSTKYIHSVRDEETKQLVESLGYQAINTGCPSMWGFTEEFCKTIPTKKAEKVVFTLTDYDKNSIQDQKLIEILNENYKEVYFWIQGVFDWEYLQTLKHTQNIKIIPPTLKAFEEVLVQNEIDYIGTRLHGGMYATQKRKRVILLAIDNRVRSLKETYNLNVVERDTIEELSHMIHSEFKTNINIKQEKIEQWLSQFN